MLRLSGSSGIGIVVLLGILSATPGQAAGLPDRDSDLSSVLLSLERSKFAALAQKDTRVLSAIFDDALLLVDFNGDLFTKAAYLESVMNSSPAQLKIVPESMTVKIFGRLALVVGTYDESGIKSGHHFHHRCRFVDTWQFNDGKWICIASTATSAP